MMQGIKPGTLEPSEEMQGDVNTGGGHFEYAYYTVYTGRSVNTA